MTRAKTYSTNGEPEDIDVLEVTSLVVTGDVSISGILTSSSSISLGTTAVYSGIGTSVIDSNIISNHYVTFDTNDSAVNISNFTDGKKVELIVRNSSGVSSHNLIIRTSTTTENHQILPTIVHSGGTIVNGVVPVSSSSGFQINIFNIGGTVVGTY